jgi:membrane-bound lytic murein transglycosylase D
MKTLRSTVLYFLIPALLLGGGIVWIGSMKSRSNSSLKGLGSHATMLSLDPPVNVHFAGELVPMRDFDVRERLDQEIIKYTFLHSATIMNIKRASRWKPIISKILEREGIPADFFYLCIAESHLSNANSPAGAKGFWQFMEATALRYGLEITEQVDERYDPVKSTVAACKYLKDAYKIFRNWTLVAASYNMGMGGLQNQINRQCVDNYYDLYLNRETAAYVFNIVAIKCIMESPAKYGFDLRPSQLYGPLRYHLVQVDTSISDLIAWSLAQGTSYKMVRVLNPWILGDKLILPETEDGQKGKIYRIAIPKEGSREDHGSELVPWTLGDTLRPDSIPSAPLGKIDVDQPLGDADENSSTK